MHTYCCRHVDRALELTGTITDPAWELADPVQLVLTADGSTARQPTTVRLLWSDEHLYVAFHCVDTDVWGTFRNRDDNICSEEVVEVFIDPRARGRSYIEIEVSPHNVIYDLYILNDPRFGRIRALKQWDCLGLMTQVHVEGPIDTREDDNAYWACEMAIPHIEIHDAPNIPPQPGDQWRVNLYRIDRHKTGDEFQAWSPTGIVNYHIPDRFGVLEFVES